MKEKRSRSRWWLVTLAVALVLVSGGLGWRLLERHGVARSAVPPRPDLGAWPLELREEIGRGEQAVQSYLHPQAGLATLGSLYYANGFYNEALQCYEGLRRLEPNEARWLHLQACILAGFGRLEDALPREQAAVALAPAYVPARLRLSDVLLKADKISDAAKSYAEVLQRDHGNSYALLGLAKCALAGRDWSRAKDFLREDVRVHPEFVGALSLLVTVNEHFGELAEAASLRAAIGKREFTDLPDPWLDDLADDCYDPYRLSVAAALAKLSGNSAVARRWLERAIKLAPTTSAYRRQLGKIMFLAHDYSPARRQFEEAVAVDSGDSDAWSALVELLTVTDDAPAAQRALSAGLASCPQSAALHYAYGQKLSATGTNDSAAIAEFKTAKRLRPDEANAYIDLALVYFRQERIDEAVAELEGALKVQPGHPLALEVLARHAIDTNDEPAARRWIAQLRAQPRVSADDLKIIAGEYRQRFGHEP